MSENLLEIRDLRKSFGNIEALKGIDLTILPGHIHALVGPNGAGKTTILRAVSGLLGEFDGQILLKGALIPDALATHSIGYLPESFGAPEMVRVHRYLDIMAAVSGRKDPGLGGRAGLMFDLKQYKKHKISQLSKGTERRLALAIAFDGPHSLIVLDEPMSGLDPAQRRELTRIIRESTKEDNIGFLLSTHELATVEELADVVHFVKEGTLARSMHLNQITDPSFVIRVGKERGSIERMEDLHWVDLKNVYELIVYEQELENVVSQIRESGMQLLGIFPNSTAEQVYRDVFDA